MTLRTSVKPQLLKWVLFLGSFFAILGACLLLFSGIALPVDSLKKWGPLLFLLSLGLIAGGLIPYRRLQKLEVNPDQLVILEKGLIYKRAGVQEWQLPFDSIQSADYIDNPWRYGILLHVENSWDIFLPYFTKRAYEELAKNLT